MKRAANTPVRSRPRKKAVAPEAPSPAESAAPTMTDASEESPAARNVGALEGALSMGLGVLLVIAALFPRSIKKLLMLTLGGGLLYRGMTGHCGVYQAVGIDTTKEPLLPQLSDKL